MGMKRLHCLLFLSYVYVVIAANAKPVVPLLQSINWPIIKAQLFSPEQKIKNDNLITLITPVRAVNAAIVPIEIIANIAQSKSFYIEKIYFIVDNNPAPVVGVLTLSPINGLASLTTRIRINAYSPVRVITQTSDGQLHMSANFVKASGGCSAPASASNKHALKRRGKMKLRQQPKQGLFQLHFMISHPNYSGLQINQLTRHWIPADYVNQVKLTLNNKQLIAFSGGISLSENPSLHFYLEKMVAGKVLAQVSDSQGRNYQQQWQVSAKGQLKPLRQ